MDRTERLLDLVALFLDATEPISWAELRESFPDDYAQGSEEAAERKFERDKAELLELGIPLAYVQGDEDRKDGYLVDRAAYYLPEPNLTPEELAVLYAAGSAAQASGAFPGQQDLAHALRKIGFFAGDRLPAARVRMELGPSLGGPVLAQRLEALRGAAFNRKTVTLEYESPRSSVTTRKVDPYALALRRGIWTLVGYCHLRQGLRTFHVHRIQSLSVNASKPRSPDFEVPADFRIGDYVASWPWQHRFHAPIEVTLSLRNALAPMASKLFPGARSEASGEETKVTVAATFLDGLLRYALSLAPDCRPLAPEEAVTRFGELASRIAAAHADPSNDTERAHG
jgi:proteasome accessory factor B